MNRKLVFGEGSRDAKIAIIGEAPGANEEREGRPFVPYAPAGKVLHKVLHSVTLTREDVYLTNIIKERPPRDDISLFFKVNQQGKVTVTKEYVYYRDLLKEELSGVKSNVFVPAGNPALYAVTGLVGITRRRGSILEGNLWPGMKVIPIIHPAAALPHKNPMYEYYIRADLRRIVEESKSKEIRLPLRYIMVFPQYPDIVQYLSGPISEVGVDIEVLGSEVSHISFAKASDNVMSISFMKDGENLYTPDIEAKIWQLIAQILEDQHVKKVGQNVIFDLDFLFRKYGIIARNFEDTMIAMGIVFPDFPKSLEFITSLYTKEPYYKDERKIWRTLKDEHRFAIYNAKDSAVAAEVFPKLHQELVRQTNLDTYQWQRRLIPPLIYMQERGMKVDAEGIQRTSEEAGKKIELLEAQLREVTGFDINPRSHQQLSDYFYTKLGVEPYLKDGKPTTDMSAMTRLARRGFKEAQIVKEIKHLGKLKSSYFDMILREDGRLRGSPNPIGTTTGRISFSEDLVTGEGGNVQTLPETMRHFVIADENCVLYSVDLEQADNRVTAYIAPEPLMIQAFVQGRSIHKQTAALIFGVHYDKVSKEPGSAPIGSGEYSQYFWGKKSNHAFNYGLGYKNFSLQNEIPESHGKMIRDRYHQMYPGIRRYWAWVQAIAAKGKTLANLYGRKRLFLAPWGDELFEDMYAFIPQSTVADKINREGLIFGWENQQWFRPAEFLNQIHDELIIQISTVYDWQVHAEILLRLAESLEKPLNWHGTAFVIPVGISMGLDLSTAHLKEVKFHGQEAGGLAKQLSDIYEQHRAERELPSMDSYFDYSGDAAEEGLSSLGDV